MDYAKIYGEMHERHPKHFPGFTVKRYAVDVAELIREYNPAQILDYGCGKGYQYLGLRVHERWGGLLPHCYDPGVRQLMVRPELKFDGLICTDVLEHIEEPDLYGVIRDAISFLKDDGPVFAFFSVSCRLAKNKTLPDGRNVHLTVKPANWWSEVLLAHKKKVGSRLKLAWACETETDIVRGVH